MNFKFLSACLMAAGLLAGCQQDNDSTHAPGDSHDEPHHESHSSGHHTGVLEISSPIKRDTLYFNEYVSQIKAHQHIELKALEKGYLQRVLVDEGQLVRKDQLLFEIQPTIYQAEIKKAKDEVAKA
jgi:membrane fusion protein (multidrug efflux system)